jgi:hypothetical protein
MALSMHTAAERPDLWERGISSEEVWPEYNLHGDDLNRWWQHLDVELADFQFVLYDEERDEVVAEATPVRCGGTGRTTRCRMESMRRWSRSSRAYGRSIPQTLSALLLRRRRAADGLGAWPPSSSRQCEGSVTGMG